MKPSKYRNKKTVVDGMFQMPATRINHQGYEVLSQVARTKGPIYVHVLIAEWFFDGSVPIGNHVHHIDESKTGHDPWNLMVCSNKQHQIIHTRLRAEKVCGNPDWRKCFICHEYDNPANLEFQRAAGFHRKCNSQKMSAYRIKHPERIKDSSRKYYKKNSIEICRKKRERLENDHEYREKRNASQRENYQKRKQRG